MDIPGGATQPEGTGEAEKTRISPESREERVAALHEAVEQGKYPLPPEGIARAILARKAKRSV